MLPTMHLWVYIRRSVRYLISKCADEDIKFREHIRNFANVKPYKKLMMSLLTSLIFVIFWVLPFQLSLEFYLYKKKSMKRCEWRLGRIITCDIKSNFNRLKFKSPW